MGYKALVVEDSPKIQGIVSDMLDSLGHQYDLAGSQEEARILLARGEYSYYLLDLEIPVRSNDATARIQNGENLLDEIHKQHSGQAPIIVMTSHGTDTPDLAVEIMKLGAVDFVTKPFRTTGKTLDKAILDALRGRRQPQSEMLAEDRRVTGRPRDGKPFCGGELIFRESHVRLCGVTIITDRGFGHSMVLLEQLRRKDPDGRFIPQRGEDLALLVDAENGVNTITSCIAHLRHNITTRLLRQKNLCCGPYDVIDRNEQGYFLRDWITIRPDPKAANGSGDLPAGFQLNPRQKWILDQLRQAVRLRRSILEQEFSISPKTAKRDLKELVGQGLIEFARSPGPGCYRLVR